jgi:hypothetical protein
MLVRKLRAEGKLDGGVGPVSLVLGQVAALAAIVLGRLARESGSVGLPFGLSLGDFSLGFMAGLGATFILASTPLSLTRRRRTTSKGTKGLPHGGNKT